jgi:hypothetical protein
VLARVGDEIGRVGAPLLGSDAAGAGVLVDTAACVCVCVCVCECVYCASAGMVAQDKRGQAAHQWSCSRKQGCQQSWRRRQGAQPGCSSVPRARACACVCVCMRERVCVCAVAQGRTHAGSCHPSAHGGARHSAARSTRARAGRAPCCACPGSGWSSRTRSRTACRCPAHQAARTARGGRAAAGVRGKRVGTSARAGHRAHKDGRAAHHHPRHHH